MCNASLSEQRLDAVLKADLKTIIMDAALDPNKRKFACFILLLNRKNRTSYQLIKNLIKHFITWNTQDSLEWILGDEKQDFFYRSQYFYLLFEMIGDKEIKGIHNQIDFLFGALGKLNSRLLLLHSHDTTIKTISLTTFTYDNTVSKTRLPSTFSRDYTANKIY